MGTNMTETLRIDLELWLTLHEMMSNSSDENYGRMYRAINDYRHYGKLPDSFTSPQDMGDTGNSVFCGVFTAVKQYIDYAGKEGERG